MRTLIAFFRQKRTTIEPPVRPHSTLCCSDSRFEDAKFSIAFAKHQESGTSPRLASKLGSQIHH